MPGVPLEWTDDPTVFASRQWDALRKADPDATFFHTPEYLKLYWEEFGADGLRVAFARGKGVTLAVAPFEVREGLLTFLGGFDVTDYMGPVGPAPARERAAGELLRGLATWDEWETADLRGLPEDGSWLPALVDAARDAGLGCEVAEDGVAPMLPLPDSLEAYLAGLKGKLRHEIRRKERRLREAFPSARLVDATSATLAADLGRFVEMHRSSPGEKGKFMHPGMELFFRRLAAALLPRGIFRLVFLEADGVKLAGAVAFRWERTLHLYNSAYHHDHVAVAPGMVLVSEIIRDVIRAGCDRLDLLKGDLEYKYRFGARPRRIARLLLRRT